MALIEGSRAARVLDHMQCAQRGSVAVGPDSLRRHARGSRHVYDVVAECSLWQHRDESGALARHPRMCDRHIHLSASHSLQNCGSARRERQQFLRLRHRSKGQERLTKGDERWSCGEQAKRRH